MVVTVKASQIVKPAEPTPEEVMYVSECDQIKPLTHAPTIYFYRPTTHELLEEAAQILKYSLSKALVTFYPLAGRLHWAEGGRVELHCNSMGALVIEAESDLKIDDFGDFRPSPEIKSLIPSADYSTTAIHEVPLLLAQITKFSCGGISLGAGMSHVLVDGQSAVHFLTEWSKIARGEGSVDRPFLDRTVLKPKEDESLALRDLKYSDFFRLPLLLGKSDNLEERRKETTAIILKLNKEQIETLRNKANLDLVSKEQAENLKNSESTQQLEALMGKASQDFQRHDPNGALKNKADYQQRHPFTRFEAVCAHIWKCASMARGLQPEQETVLFVTVDFRNRLNPPLPKRYFGNAVMPSPATATVGELLSKPLGYAARKIREAIEKVTDEYVRAYLHCIKNIPNLSNFRHFHTVGCSQGSFYGNPNLIVTSWVGLPMYDAKFGWGDEVYLGPGSLGYDGRAFLIPSQNGDGSFTIPLRFQVEHVSAFEKYFMEGI